MSLIAAEERNYSIAEAAATGIVERGRPVPCSGCKGAGMVPTTWPLRDKSWMVPVDYGVTFCTDCGGSGEAKPAKAPRR